MKLTTERKSLIILEILMYKTTVYTLVNDRIIHQKQQISEKKVTLLCSALTLWQCNVA